MIVDCHVHLSHAYETVAGCVDALLSCADKFGIDKLCMCLGFGREQDPTPEQLQAHNEQVAEALALAPERLIGFVYLSPAHVDVSLGELEKYAANGPMRGVKLWVARRCSDPCVDPIVERAAELGLPILQHTWLKATGNYPNESTPDDMAALAERCPEAKLIFGHTGGDWEYGVMAVRGCPNVYADLSGGAPTAGVTELAVAELGAERVLFGSDAPGRSFASQIAKVLGADVPRQAKDLILGQNLARLLPGPAEASAT